MHRRRADKLMRNHGLSTLCFESINFFKKLYVAMQFIFRQNCIAFYIEPDNPKRTNIAELQIYQMLENHTDEIAIVSLLENVHTKIDFYRDKFLDGIGKLIPHCVMVAITTIFF